MKKSIYYLSIIIFLNSCLAVYYRPTINPAPLFEEKGDVSAEITVTPTTQLNANAAVAVHDNIGLYAGGSLFKREVTWSGNSVEEKVNGKVNQFYFGAGYFVNKKQQKNFRFEIFGDFNYGAFNNVFVDRDSQNFAHIFNGNFTKISIMPHFGYVNDNKTFSASYGIKFGQLSFSNDSRTGNFWNYDYNSRYSQKTSFTMIEHAMTIKAGRDILKFMFQLGLSQAIGAVEAVNSVPGYRLTSNFGVAFNFNYLNRRTQNP